MNNGTPMNTKCLLVLICLSAGLFGSLAAADDGHNHDAAPALTGPALPRFSAVSDTFELVGVVSGKQLTVYLDRFADNTPVKGATVELEVGGMKVALKEHEDGEFEGTLAQELKPGMTAVTATVVAGNETDILGGDLDVHAAEHDHEAEAAVWPRYAIGGAAALALLLCAAVLMRRASGHRARFGGAA